MEVGVKVVDSSLALVKIINENSYSHFSDKVKELRDTLTHLNNAYSIIENSNVFYPLFDYLQCLFYAVIFRKIGFSDDDIKKSLDNIRSVV